MITFQVKIPSIGILFEVDEHDGETFVSIRPFQSKYSLYIARCWEKTISTNLTHSIEELYHD